MKKLILGLIVGVAMIAGTSVSTKAACSGVAVVCLTDIEDVQRDIDRNCDGDTTDLEVIVLAGC